jgi:methionyl-tRNA formyltransferase
MFTSIYPILRGEKSSGVTLHKIDNGIDTGDIIDQIEFDMPFGITGLKLYKLYLKYSKELLYKNINKIINLQFNSTQQPLIGASYFSNKSIDFKSIKIDFNNACFEICNYVNAFSFRPYQLVSFQNVEISKATALNVKSKIKPGKLISENNLYFEIASVDYNVRLLKDKLKDILECSSKNDLESIKEYHNKNFDLDEKNVKGWNALIVACFNGAFDIVKFIIQNKTSNVNDANNNGTSVLMYAMTNATETNDFSIMEYLIKEGANHKHTDYKGLDVFYYANEYGNQKVINYLSEMI